MVDFGIVDVRRTLSSEESIVNRYPVSGQVVFEAFLGTVRMYRLPFKP